ncbi:MAG: hypothetical protein WCI76_01410 [bacterium]
MSNYFSESKTIIKFLVILAALSIELLLVWQKPPSAQEVPTKESPQEILEAKLMDLLVNNPKELFTTYKAELAQNKEDYTTCHGLLHKLGHTAFTIYGFSGAMNISQNLCGGGFVHGIIEEKFGTLKTLNNGEKIAQAMAEACDSPENQICYHGVGHGLMILLHNDSQQALKVCSSVPHPGRNDCYDGIFMHIFDNEETGIAKNIPEHKLGLNFCKNVSFEEMDSCYFYSPRIFAQERDMEKNSVQSCIAISAETLHIFPKAKAICAMGSGHMFTKYLLPDYEKGKQSCNAFHTALRSFCVQGANMYKEFNENTSA